MKLLIAIPSSNPKELQEKTLLWAPRAGFELRVFTDPNVKKKHYHAAVEEVNYQKYLDVRHSQLVSGTNPLEYAQDNGFDLLAVVPPNLYAWNDNPNKDEMILDFQADLGGARKKIGSDSKLHDLTFKNGTRVVRIVRI